jgi:integrase
MANMPRPRLPFLHRIKTRHGRHVWYVRKGEKRNRIRIRADYGTPEFQAEYDAAIAGARPQVAVVRTSTGSLKWLWERFRDTGQWAQLGPTTRRARENVMAHVLEKAGHEPYAAIQPADILAGRDARAATPSQAKCFLVIMRAMYRWALLAGHVDADPTVGVMQFKKKKNGGFLVWTDADVDAYQARWPLGTIQRVWLDVMLFTGLRRGDAVRLGRQHCRTYTVRNEAGEIETRTVATLRTEKGGFNITVTLPILPILAKTLEAGPTGELAFICGHNGKPLKKTSFGNAFKEACVLAGVNENKKAAHGVRKIGATTAADNGATEKELDAIFGWEGGNVSRIYTEAANRKRASMRAAAMLERTPDEHSMDAPAISVRPSVKLA